MNDDLESRKGIFNISMDMIRSYGMALGIQIMSEVFVVKAEHHYMSNAVEYCAYSKHFEPVAPGQVVPRYSVVIDGAGLIFVRFEKIDG